MASTLTYNHNDYSMLLGQGEEEEKVELHQPSLIRQIIYNMLITCLSFR